MCGKIMTVLLIFVDLNCSVARYSGRLHCIVGVLPTCYKRKAATYFYPPPRVARGILPCETPCSCSKVSDNVEPIRTLKDLSDKKFDIKFGNRFLRPISCKSFMMPYFHVVSYAFSRSKNIATQCSFLINASRIKDSNRTK